MQDLLKKKLQQGKEKHRTEARIISADSGRIKRARKLTAPLARQN